jgi:hypothetical protein
MPPPRPPPPIVRRRRVKSEENAHEMLSYDDVDRVSFHMKHLMDKKNSLKKATDINGTIRQLEEEINRSIEGDSVIIILSMLFVHVIRSLARFMHIFQLTPRK